MLVKKGIFSIDSNFGEVTKVYSEGTSSDLSVRNGSMVFTQPQPKCHQPRFTKSRANTGQALPITQVNKEVLADIQFAEFDQFSFPGANEETVYGYWMKPWNYVEGKKYPIAFIVHGGPQGSFGNMFNNRWNAQLWAAQGFGVVMIDFHGSTGYGQAFTDSIARDWGGKPLEDLKKASHTSPKNNHG
ncbi:MAG: prolyl oligopeptidase family serine peptidase [Rheinheimera sp.]|nr:prolyl oligopeptidase family serine peptidase [Rheinheimera sp.]